MGRREKRVIERARERVGETKEEEAVRKVAAEKREAREAAADTALHPQVNIIQLL